MTEHNRVSQRLSPWWAVAAILIVIAFLADARYGLVVAVWLGLWGINAGLTECTGKAARWIVPIFFGLSLILLWELSVSLFKIGPVILPAPSVILARIIGSAPILWADFTQTVLKGAVTGFVIGSLAAVLTAIAIDRSPFLQRGLLPLGNFVAALPIVGIAPIMVMWFGFDWQSKAAVVVVMVFFPVLVNMVAGLKATDHMQRDLMATYSASYGQSLLKLRLPAAMPFLFNGLKIASSLALIGAIVAEFFGSPTVGMGFRINASIGQLALDMIWAEITIAAIAGSAFYGLVSLIERKITFWHPSSRQA